MTTTAEQIRALRTENPAMSPAMIAEELGVSRQRVSQVMQRAGMMSDMRGIIPARVRPGPTKSFLERAPFGQILDLLDLSNEAAAEALGAHPVTVAKYANGTIVPPEGVQLYMLAALALGRETLENAAEAGRRKLKAAVDAAKA